MMPIGCNKDANSGEQPISFGSNPSCLASQEKAFSHLKTTHCPPTKNQSANEAAFGPNTVARRRAKVNITCRVILSKEESILHHPPQKKEPPLGENLQSGMQSHAISTTVPNHSASYKWQDEPSTSKNAQHALTRN